MMVVDTRYRTFDTSGELVQPAKGLGRPYKPSKPRVTDLQFIATSCTHMAIPKVPIARKSSRNRMVTAPTNRAKTPEATRAPAKPTGIGRPKPPNASG